MALVTNGLTTFASVGNREHLIDMIYNISPTETPFLSSIEKISTTSTKHEWQTDALAAASGTNKVLEGDEATTDAAVATVRLYNYRQISDKVAAVTGTQEVINKAGRKSQMAYEMAKRSQELKRDVETRLCGNYASVAGNATTEPECAGIEAFIATNDDFGAGGASPVGADGTAARTDGTQRAFTETSLKNALQLAWAQGGNPDMIMVGGWNKQVMSGFSGNAARTIDAGEQKLVASIKIYASDFGDIKVVASRFSRSRSALILDSSLWKFAVLRDFTVSDLAKSGDYTRKQLLVEYTLQASNEKGNAGVFDLTTS